MNGNVELNLWANVGLDSPPDTLYIYAPAAGNYITTDSSTTYNSSVVPEPGTIVLLAAGLSCYILFGIMKSRLLPKRA